MDDRMKVEAENITLENFSPASFFEAFLRITKGDGNYKVEKVEEDKKPA